MGGAVCPECGITPGSLTCDECLKRIQETAIARWRHAGVPRKDIVRWDAGRFDPTAAKSWHEQGIEPEDACAWRDLGVTPADAVTWRSADFSPADADRWITAGVTVKRALEWRRLRLDDDVAVEWARSGLTPVDATGWVADFTPAHAAKWAAEGVGPTEARELRAAGVSVDDEEWHGVPVRDRQAWVAAGIEAYEAWAWSTLLAEPSTAGPMTERSPAGGLTLKEAIGWAAARFSTWEDSERYFGEFRLKGLTPQQASELADLGEEYGVDPFAVDDLHDEYQSHGIPTDFETVHRWRPLDGATVLVAIDRGFTSAAEFTPFADLDVTADDVRPYLERHADPIEAKASWLAERTDVAASVWVIWLRAGYTTDEAEVWIKLSVTPGTALTWGQHGFKASDARPWIRSGFKSPVEASSWKASRFSAKSAAEWSTEGFAPTVAARWARAGVDVGVAARRRDAGLGPPSS